MKKFFYALFFETILMLEVALIIFTMKIDIRPTEGIYSVEFPYPFVIAVLILITIAINGIIYKKIYVVRISDAPLILKSDDEREQSIINKYAIIGFAYITPIIVLIGLAIIMFSLVTINDIAIVLKIIGYVSISFIFVPHIIHTALVIRAIKKV